LHRLAVLYPDEAIAGILNRQGRKTAVGERFSVNRVGGLRRNRNIPRFQPPAEVSDQELVSVHRRLAVAILPRGLLNFSSFTVYALLHLRPTYLVVIVWSGALASDILGNHEIFGNLRREY
jgi:hypothetical protein